MNKKRVLHDSDDDDPFEMILSSTEQNDRRERLLTLKSSLLFYEFPASKR